MEEYISPSDLMSRNVRALPEKDVEIPSGGKVRVRALAGYNALKCAGSDIADKTLIAITYGLIKPRLKPSMVAEYIDQHLDDADFIASEVGILTKEFNEAENKELEKAKKN